MLWIDRMNKAIEYIENHLNDELDYNIIAQKACCSYYNFQRIFSFIFNMPLSEYVRGRRLTLAAAELMNGKTKIIDVAIKYGYGSQEAFSRAFLKCFGTSPTAVKTGSTVLPLYKKATVNLNGEFNNNMNKQSFVLENKEPSSILIKSDGLMGWMRFSITTWSYLKFIGQANDPWQTYSLIASLCGEAFSPVNYAVSTINIKYMLKVLGFEHEVYSSNSSDAEFIDRESMRNLIVNHISEKRLPVLMCNDNALSLGSRGIIIGYENNGDKLIYLGCFPFLNGGSFEPINIPVENWYTKNTIFTLIGHRIAFPEAKEIYSSGIQQSLHYLYDGTDLRNSIFYNEWKRVLAESPDEMINELKATKNQPRDWSLYESFFDDVTDIDYENMLLEIVDPLWCDFALRRYSASNFMEQVKNHFPQAGEHIERARVALKTIHDIITEYPKKTGWIGGEGIESIDKEKFFDLNVRKEMINIVDQCRHEEQNVVEHLQKICNSINS